MSRPKRLGRRARLAVGAAALGGLIAVLATARAAQIEPDAGRTTALAVADDLDIELHDIDPTWTLAADPIQRIGYRHGRRHAFEVVPLGPTAVEVEVSTAKAFLAMRAAAADAGVELGLASGFRTLEQQRALYRAWRKGRGNKAARPGLSNHQSGRALDLAFGSDPAALAWLKANAASFGFKRTVRGEPWHWEFVDIPVARGATKRSSSKAAKSMKTMRPTRRPSSIAKTLRSSGARVASSRR